MAGDSDDLSRYLRLGQWTFVTLPMDVMALPKNFCDFASGFLSLYWWIAAFCLQY